MTGSPRPCMVCSKKGGTMRCGGCLMVWYCSKECQKKHWKVYLLFVDVVYKPNEPNKAVCMSLSKGYKITRPEIENHAAEKTTNITNCYSYSAPSRLDIVKHGEEALRKNGVDRACLLMYIMMHLPVGRHGECIATAHSSRVTDEVPSKSPESEQARRTAERIEWVSALRFFLESGLVLGNDGGVTVWTQ